jgi:hypothetical protein
MSTLPAHIRAILSGSVHARSVAPCVAAGDRAPVFTKTDEPSQRARGSASRTMLAVEQGEEIESHDSPCIESSEDFALSVDLT